MIALTSVWCGFPGFRELPYAMPHHQRKLTSIRRKLIKHVGMITVKRLTVGRLAIRIKLTWIRDDRSANCETTLLFDVQRRDTARPARLCARGSGDEQEYSEQDWLFTYFETHKILFKTPVLRAGLQFLVCRSEQDPLTSISSGWLMTKATMRANVFFPSMLLLMILTRVIYWFLVAR